MKAVIEIPDIPAAVRSLRFYPPLNDAEFEAFCGTNEVYRIERTREGVIEVVSPTGMDTGGGNAEIITQLRTWANTCTEGKAYDSNTGYHLPDGSMLSPDASYVKAERFSKLSRKERKRIPHLCPEFIMELISETDTLAKSKKKMKRWMENGVELGWLLEPEKERVWVYRQGAVEPEVVSGTFIDGSGCIEGFRLDLEKVWNEYR